MPSRLGKRKDYNLVDDSYDTRVPLHNEDAFRHGIHFKAKYIGTLDVPRPTGRMEIVVAMRRIRYEFKAKSIKKRKVNVSVSTEGVKVTLRKKKKKNEWEWDLERMLIMQDPVYRIFYVSHDSHDLKIWSYIARDGSSNVFRCNVFKSPKKSQAMRVVRTVGQAFEVCHKLNIGPPVTKKDENANNEKEAKAVEGKKDEKMEVGETDTDEATDKSKATSPGSIATNGVTDLDAVQSKSKSQSSADKTTSVQNDTSMIQSLSEPLSMLRSIDSKTPLSTHHKMQLLQQQLQQSEQQTQIAVAQVHLLKDQLAAETTARLEAQARNHQLLLQNRDLLEQMSKLTAALSEVEAKLNNTTGDQSYSLGLSRILVDATTPASGDVNLPTLSGVDMTKVSPFLDTSLFENTNTGNVQTPELSKHIEENGIHAAATDTSTSTITKSSTASGPVVTRVKKNGLKHDDAYGSSSDSSTDDEMAGGPVHLASESGTVKNAAMASDSPAINKTPNRTALEQTCDTSIWTSGIRTPARPTGVSGYQRSSINFEDTTLSTTADESMNASNGYTLSPIFRVGGESNGGTPQSSFQHFSISDPDTPSQFDPVGPKQPPLKLSKSLHANMQEKQILPTTSHSSSELMKVPNGNNSVIKWLTPGEKELDGYDELFLAEKLENSPDLTSDIATTPRLHPPPRAKRAPSARVPPEYRPRPEAQHEDMAEKLPRQLLLQEAAKSEIFNNILSHPTSTSDSDLEVPNKLPRYHKNEVKSSQSSYEYGSDPLLSRFDPLLAKSKSFENSSTEAWNKMNPLRHTLSPVQDVPPTGRSDLLRSETTQSSPDTKRYGPLVQGDLSKSSPFLERSSNNSSNLLFSSHQDFETKLKYEPLRKQQASEWRDTPPFISNKTKERLNSSFHAGDQPLDTPPRRPMRFGGDDPRTHISVYQTYSDLTSTITPVKKEGHPKNCPEVNGPVKNIGSYNTNSNNSVPEKISSTDHDNSLVSLDSESASEEDGRSNVTFMEPASVDGNISLLDDLLITEATDDDDDVTDQVKGSKVTNTVAEDKNKSILKENVSSHIISEKMISDTVADDNYQLYAQLLSPISLSSKESFLNETPQTLGNSKDTTSFEASVAESENKSTEISTEDNFLEKE